MDTTDVVETFEHNGYTVKIILDNTPENPRECDHLGTMICFHGKYDLGDNNGGRQKFVLNQKFPEYRSEYFNSWDELETHIIKNEKPVNMFPLYMYEHSGVTIRTYSFEDRWDSGQIGFIFATRKDVQEYFGVKNITVDIRERVAKYLLLEVEEYDQYLRGNVFGYRITLDGEEYDSCWGYYGIEGVREEAKGICKERKNADLRRELIKV